jgi:3-deoxy-D-manno-octulosonic-acid transferase
MTPAAEQVARGRAWRASVARPVVMMASSREGEEEPLLQAWLGLRAPRPLLLLVPRHPQRFDTVAQLVRTAGLSLAQRSAWQAGPVGAQLDADVWLGDSLGEMPVYFGAADVALLGGSFAPLGGQNLIEAAACGCPVVMGPHTFNFAQAAQLSLAARAAIRVQTIDEGVARAVALAGDAEREAWSARALAFAAEHRGAALRMASRVLQIVDEAAR